MNLNELLLYRGDSSKIDSFDINKTDPMALFGKGIYLTDNKTIADDYTMKAGKNIIFISEKARSIKELIKEYLYNIMENDLNYHTKANKIHDEARDNLWDDIKNNSSEEMRNKLKSDQKKLYQSLFKKAKEIFSTRMNDFRIKKDTTGKFYIVDKNRTSQITTFDIPEEYLSRTINSDIPLTDQEINIIGKFIIQIFGDRILDFRNLDGKMISYKEYIDNFKKYGARYAWEGITIGGKGKNPTLDELWNGTHAGYHIFKGEHQDQFIKFMQNYGYVGIEYQGGKRLGSHVRGGGGELHRAFVLWDSSYINKWKIDVDISRDERLSLDIHKGLRTSGFLYSIS